MTQHFADGEWWLDMTEEQESETQSMSNETPRNPDIEQVIRESLAATASWEWSDEDRKWSAAGAAQKYLEAHSTMSSDLAHGIALKITEEIMKEEAQA